MIFSPIMNMKDSMKILTRIHNRQYGLHLILNSGYRDSRVGEGNDKNKKRKKERKKERKIKIKSF